MTQIIQQISAHPILKIGRSLRLKQISYIDFDVKEARVVWEELLLDDKKAPITSETVTNRTIVSNISNANTVNQSGIVIDETNFPKGATETDEAYQTRLSGLKKVGFPEFDFYVGAIINKQAIGQAITLLDTLKRFNRK